MRSVVLIALVVLVQCAAQAQTAESAAASAVVEQPVSPPAASSTENPPASVPVPGAGSVMAKPIETPDATSATPKVDVTSAISPAASDTKTAASTGEVKVPKGYRKGYREGELVFCRMEGVMGTRFASKVCYTPQELKDIEERRERASDELTRRARVCGGASCQ